MNKIEVDEARYQDLLEKEKLLMCLEGAGVDNWEGWDYAMEMLEEMDEEK